MIVPASFRGIPATLHLMVFSMLLSAALCGELALGQDAGAPAQPQNATPPSQEAAKPQDPSQASDTKKPKKVWTNENLSGANGSVSVVGDPRNLPKNKPGANKPADAQYAASVKKQLEKLQAQIDDIDKQLADFKRFNSGEPSPTSGSVQLHKGYSRDPVDAQMKALETKKKDLQAKMDALLDDARKRGVEPGQLR
jgi:hypothetical protein